MLCCEYDTLALVGGTALAWHLDSLYRRASKLNSDMSVQEAQLHAGQWNVLLDDSHLPLQASVPNDG